MSEAVFLQNNPGKRKLCSFFLARYVFRRPAIAGHLSTKARASFSPETLRTRGLRKDSSAERPIAATDHEITVAYYHEYCMLVDVTRDSPTWQPPTEDAEEIMTEALRDLAGWLYRQLEAEDDHLTSDEAIEEGIIVNEYTFAEAGRRFG